MTVDPLAGLLAAWLPRQRWFAGKGAPVGSLSITTDATLAAGDVAEGEDCFVARYVGVERNIAVDEEWVKTERAGVVGEGGGEILDEDVRNGRFQHDPISWSVATGRLTALAVFACYILCRTIIRRLLANRNPVAAERR